MIVSDHTWRQIVIDRLGSVCYVSPEYEIGEDGNRTGLFRRSQYYANRAPNGRWLRDSPCDRKPCEFREFKR